MPTSETFYVSSKSNKIYPIKDNPREYFIKDGKYLGKAKYIIEVFGDNHEKVANTIKNMVDNSNFDNKLFLIKVETK